MKRSAPMKRSGFQRKVSPRLALDVAGQRAPLRPIRAVAPRAEVFNPQPKHDYVRSDALMRAYRALPCQHCGAEGESAGGCGAHANWAVFGKGKGIKADDTRCASLCWQCHSHLDQGWGWSEETRKHVWARAHLRTVRKLVAMALWPAVIEVPPLDSIWDLLGVRPAVEASHG